jgi:hypothetical protein
VGWVRIVRRGSDRVWRGSDSSASACCMAGPSSNLGSAVGSAVSTPEEALFRTEAMRRSRVAVDGSRRVINKKYCIYC